MNVKEITTKIKELYADYDDSQVDDVSDESMWRAFKYDDTDDIFPNKEEFFVELAEEYGGEGQGDEFWIVLKVTEGDNIGYLRVDGWYASFAGGELDGDPYEVQPKEATVTVWEKVA